MLTPNTDIVHNSLRAISHIASRAEFASKEGLDEARALCAHQAEQALTAWPGMGVNSKRSRRHTRRPRSRQQKVEAMNTKSQDLGATIGALIGAICAVIGALLQDVLLSAAIGSGVFLAVLQLGYEAERRAEPPKR